MVQKLSRDLLLTVLLHRIYDTIVGFPSGMFQYFIRYFVDVLPQKVYYTFMHVRLHV